jgi:DNA-binding CsgD family transcriptional regulator
LITSAIIDLRSGRSDRAAASLQESLATTRGLSDSANVTRALDLLAIVVVEAGEHERAARLLGAAWSAAGHTSIGAKQFRRRREETREHACVALGEEAFQAAYADGASMSVEDAIAYACGRTAEVACDPPTVAVSAGARLTRRELEVAELVAQGLSNKRIAAKLVLAQRTAEAHVENILRKLGFTSRAQIAAWHVERQRRRPGPGR